MGRLRKALCSAVLLVVVSCSGAPNPAEGNIVGLNGSQMTVRAEGEDLVFDVSGAGVPLEHLNLHMRDRLPVRVTWKKAGGRMAATSITDK